MHQTLNRPKNASRKKMFKARTDGFGFDVQQRWRWRLQMPQTNADWAWSFH
jgi:hypothetical protein